MLKHEFETLIGRDASDNEYVIANAMYMSAGDIDKQTFCADYVKHQDSIILKAIWHGYNIQKDGYEAALESRNEAIEEREALKADMGDFLVERAEHFNSRTIRTKAIATIGIKAYLKKKVERGDQFWQEDYNDLNALLGDDGLMKMIDAIE